MNCIFKSQSFDMYVTISGISISGTLLVQSLEWPLGKLSHRHIASMANVQLLSCIHGKYALQQICFFFCLLGVNSQHHTRLTKVLQGFKVFLCVFLRKTLILHKHCFALAFGCCCICCCCTTLSINFRNIKRMCFKCGRATWWPQPPH